MSRRMCRQSPGSGLETPTSRPAQFCGWGEEHSRVHVHQVRSCHPHRQILHVQMHRSPCFEQVHQRHSNTVTREKLLVFSDGLSSAKDIGTSLLTEKNGPVFFLCSTSHCPQLLSLKFWSAVGELQLIRNHRSRKAERNNLIKKNKPSYLANSCTKSTYKYFFLFM